MESQTENSGQEVLGSLGWLVDRTNQQVLGTVWLADNSQAISCAHLVVPYASFPEALQVSFPATGIACGVKDMEFHPDFDRWMAKRIVSQSGMVPSYDLISQHQNVVALKLTNVLKPLDRDLMGRVNAALILPVPSQENTLVSGQAGRIELTSVLQTLVNARNYGTLVLTNDRNQTVARMFLEDGKLTHAQFRNSRNEDAIYRLITSEIERFPFHFLPQSEASWCNFPPMVKSTTFLLMEAYRRMEEQSQLVQQLGGLNAVAVRVSEQLNFDLLPEEWRPLSAYIWNCINPEMSLGSLTRSLSLDGYSVLGSVQTLLSSGQIAIEQREAALASSSLPLVMSVESHLTNGDDVYALGIDPYSYQPVLMRAYIIEEFWQGLEHHMVSSASLPLELAGAPLVKDGAVVGIHCGPLVQEFGVYGDGFEPQLFISVSSAFTCLGLHLPKPGLSGSFPTVPDSEVTFATESSTALSAVNAASSAKVAQSNSNPDLRATGSSDSHSAMRSKSSMETREIAAPLQKFSSLFGSIKGAVDNFKKVPPPPAGQFLQAQMLRQTISSNKFVKTPDKTEFLTGDFVRFEVKTFEDCYIYMVAKPSTSQPPKLHFPYTYDEDQKIEKGMSITIPEKVIERAGGNHASHSGSGKHTTAGVFIPSSPGKEDVYLIASRKPLFEAFTMPNAEQIIADNLEECCRDVPHASAITLAVGVIIRGVEGDLQAIDTAQRVNILCMRMSHTR